MGKESGTKFFKDDNDPNLVRQIRINPQNFRFRTLREIAQQQFLSLDERQCVLVMATRRQVLSPEYFKDAQNLPNNQFHDHILSTAKDMQKASAIHIIYKAGESAQGIKFQSES